MAFPLLDLNPQRVKREREEEEEQEEQERERFEWQFVGRDASGGLTYIPYRFIVSDGSEIDERTSKYLRENRSIHKFNFKVVGTPFATPASGSQAANSAKKKMRAAPQQMIPVFEERSGFVIHSKWIGEEEFEM